MEREAQQRQTYRMRILAVVESSHHALTGREIAHATGIPYKKTIDALNALHNYGRVHRIGKKFTAKWIRVTPKQNFAYCPHRLNELFLSLRMKNKK